MGKAKSNPNKDGQNFFVRNVEKMILVVVLLLFIVLVYTGYSLESLPSDRTPDKLVASAKQAKTNVSNPENWKGIAATLVVPTGFQQRLTLEEIDSTVYELEKPIDPKITQSGQRRQDPTLFPPEKVEAMAITGPVAYFMKRGEVDQWAEIENSAHEAPKAPKPSARNRRQMEGYPGGSSDGYGAEMGSRGMMSGMPSSSSAGMPGMGMPGMGMPGMPGMGMPGEDPNSMVGAIFADPQYRTGYRAGPGSVAKSETCVVVKALVPYRKLWDEYELKFMEALGYNPSRDVPRFLTFTAERAEVTDDPNAPLEWARVAYTLEQNDHWRTAGYAGFPPEVADQRYLHPFVLTMPVPPFINRDLDKIALHSDVPKMQPPVPKPMTEEQKAEKEKKEKELAKKKGEAKAKQSDIPQMPGMQGMQGAMPGMGMPGMGMPGAEAGMGMPGMGMPGMSMPGMSMPGSGMPGMAMMGGESGTMGMPGMSGYSGDMGMMGSTGSMGMGMPGMGMPGMGMPGMEGMGAMYDANGQLIRGPQVPHLMVRFFDFTAEVGKKYRYRVQVYLEDPNHPMDVRWEPTERYLHDDVKKRLGKQIAEEKAKKNRTYFVRTEFSEPSEIVSVNVNPETHVGKIAAGRFVPIKEAGPNLMFQADEPTGKVMGVVWDAEKAVDVAVIVDGYRGTCLNLKTAKLKEPGAPAEPGVPIANVIHPVTLVYKVLPDYPIQTDNYIADIKGGEEFVINDKTNPLTSIGEYAYFDHEGRLQVGNELDDLDNFRKLAMPEAPPTTPGMMAPGMDAGAEMGMPGMMPGMEMADPRGKRKKKN